VPEAVARIDGIALRVLMINLTSKGRTRRAKILIIFTFTNGSEETVMIS
jgi:hypothetical protein